MTSPQTLTKNYMHTVRALLYHIIGKLFPYHLALLPWQSNQASDNIMPLTQCPSRNPEEFRWTRYAHPQKKLVEAR